MNEVLSFSAKGMEVEDIMVNDVGMERPVLTILFYPWKVKKR
jgi:hypothetical protein